MAFLTPLQSLVKIQFVFWRNHDFFKAANHQSISYWLEPISFICFLENVIFEGKLACKLVKDDTLYFYMIRHSGCGLLTVNLGVCIKKETSFIKVDWHRVAWGHATFSVWGRWQALDLAYFYHHFTLSIIPFDFLYSCTNSFLCSYAGFYAQVTFPLNVLIFHLSFY